MRTNTTEGTAFQRAIPIARAALRFPGTALQVILDAACDHVGAQSARAFHITEQSAMLLARSGGGHVAPGAAVSGDESAHVRALIDGILPETAAYRPGGVSDWSVHTGRPIQGDGYVIAIFAGRGSGPIVDPVEIRDELVLYMTLAALGLENDRLKSELDDLYEDRAILGATFRHDLRHPIQAVTAAAALLANEDQPLDVTERAEMLEMIRCESARLNSMLDATFADSLAHDHVPPKLERIEVVDVVTAVVASGKSGRTGQISLDIEPSELTTDPARLERALRNLIDNALKYAPSGDVIDVLGRRTEDDYVIHVIDGGPGVESDLVHRLFTPFFRDASRVDSTGLGLASAATLVASLGGRVSYSRRERTIFEIVVPLDSSLKGNHEAH